MVVDATWAVPICFDPRLPMSHLVDCACIGKYTDMCSSRFSAWWQLIDWSVDKSSAMCVRCLGPRAFNLQDTKIMLVGRGLVWRKAALLAGDGGQPAAGRIDDATKIGRSG